MADLLGYFGGLLQEGDHEQVTFMGAACCVTPNGCTPVILPEEVHLLNLHGRACQMSAFGTNTLGGTFTGASFWSLLLGVVPVDERWW